MLSNSGISQFAREVTALGTIVIGLRLFAHLCPFFNSETYQAVAESFDMHQLRRAAGRFLQPKYWGRIWQQDEWRIQEVVYFCFGLWAVLWAAVAAEIGSFLLGSQLTKTIIHLVDSAFLGSLSADELVASLMIVLVIVPVILFIALAVFYVVTSLSRALPKMEIWRVPGKLDGGLAGVGLLVTLLQIV